MTIAALTRIVAPFAVGRDATDITGLTGELWFRTRDQGKKLFWKSIGWRFWNFSGYGAGTRALAQRLPLEQQVKAAFKQDKET